MHVSLPYHTGAFDLEMPSRSGIRIVGNTFPRPLENPREELRKSLDGPVGAPSLKKILPRSGGVSILISDLTRGG